VAGLGMAAGTSPSLVESPDGSWLSAFQDNFHQLYLRNSAGDNTVTGLGMAPGTSPSLVELADGSWLVAINDNHDQLYLRNSAGDNLDTGLGMAPGTSPSLVESPGGGWLVAFQDNLHQVYLRNSAGNNTVTGLGMAPRTSPSLAESPDGSWLVAFQDNYHQVYLRNSAGENTVTRLGMAPRTSPSLAAPPSNAIVEAAESQVGYEDDPAGTYCNKFSAYWGAGSLCSNGNYSEEWCADFTAWAWQQGGVSFTYGYSPGDLNGAAASFYQWATDHGTWHPAGSGYTPQPGDAVIYGLNSAGTSADHVAIVTSYTPGDAGPNVVNGDWWSGGNGGVVAASDQTTATGTDGISGYASP
jgi:hypothetical protein